MEMRFGFIGSGTVSQAFSKHLLMAGHEVIISNSRGPESLRELVETLGARAHAGTPREACEADFVILAVPWINISEALTDLPPWKDRILIDATNHYATWPTDQSAADVGEKTSSEIVASLAPGARIIKALNSVPMIWISNFAEKKPKTVIFVSGDDHEAKRKFIEVLDQLGFAGIDLGGLAPGGRMQQLNGPLCGLNLNFVKRLKS
jgi:8-hydroxy-5-deazaflavin:NADPH oxidoreductase